MAGLMVAVTGGGGVLGRALSTIRPDWRYLSRADANVRDASALYAALAALKPQVVLHAAALTDHAHPDAREVIHTNVVGTQHVARIARVLGARVVYVSTHYVYPGETGGYTEYDDVSPIGVYAMSKYAAEQAVWANCVQQPLVVRGSWYTRATRLDHWAKRGALTDAWCSRERVEDAARKIVALVEAEVRGVVNIGGARRSFRDILTDEGYTSVGVTRAEVDASWGLPYPFPADVSVSTAKFDALQLDWRGV